MRSPIRWLGGKGQWADDIVRVLPPHQTYVEPFGGGASVLFAKAPSPIEVYNDIDSGLVNFFRVLRDPEQFERFQRLVQLTPYSREEMFDCYDRRDDEADMVERARRWFVITRQSFGATLSSWGMTINASQNGMSQTTSSWLSSIEHLPAIHRRLAQVQIEHTSWERVIDLYETPDTLFYLDPPYVPATRAGGEYRHELSLEDHERLVGRLVGSSAKFVLSGYPHPVYEPLEDLGWQIIMRQRHVSVAGGSSSSHATRTEGGFARTDTLWVSPSATVQQHFWDVEDWGRTVEGAGGYRAPSE